MTCPDCAFVHELSRDLIKEIGRRAKGWLKIEIDDWLWGRIAERDSAL